MRKIKQALTSVLRRDPPARGNPRPIPPIEGATFNICLTTLLTPRTAPAWQQNNLVSAAWTEVLALPAFDLFRDAADRYYKSLDGAGALVPTVTRYKGSIRIEFEIDGYLSVALFDPGQVRMGYGRRGEPIGFRTVRDGEAVAA